MTKTDKLPKNEKIDHFQKKMMKMKKNLTITIDNYSVNCYYLTVEIVELLVAR